MIDNVNENPQQENPNALEEAKQEALNNAPIVLNLSVRKVNYILNILMKLPYEQSYMVVDDLRQMVVTQLPSEEEIATQAAEALKKAAS